MTNNLFIDSLILSFAVQIFFFSFAAAFKTDKVTDLSYGLTFIILAFFGFIKNPTPNIIQILTLIFVILWGLRISTYLLIRIIKTKKDRRFDGVREKFWSFAKFWTLQALSVWFIMLPSTYILNLSNPIKLNLVLLIIGSIVWIIGITTETIADIQKYNFKNNPLNKDKWIDTGIWKYSRHPNYFGEMLCWWGIFIIVLPHLTGLSWLTLLGPLFITSLLLFVSGIPPLEKRADEKFGKNKAYLNYKNKTSLLIPLPNKT